MKKSRFAESQIVAIFTASRGGRISDRPLPRTRHEYGQFLLVALEVRSNGCLVDEAPQGAGSRKFTP